MAAGREADRRPRRDAATIEGAVSIEGGPGPISLYGLTEEHELLRKAVRELAEDKIAPRAAEIDETAEYPWDVHEELKRADLLAIHVPEQYGGAGADQIAHCIVVEEIARVCASSLASSRWATSSARSGMILSGSEDLKRRYLPRWPRGEATFSYALSEREAGSDAAVDEDPRGAGTATPTCSTAPSAGSPARACPPTTRSWRSPTRDRGANGISRLRRARRRPGLLRRHQGAQARHQGLADLRDLLRRLPDPGRPDDRRAGHRLHHRAQDPRPHPARHRRPGGRHRAGRPRRGRRPTSRSAGSSARRIADFQGVQFMLADMAMRIEAARQLVYVAAASGRARRPRPDLPCPARASASPPTPRWR